MARRVFEDTESFGSMDIVQHHSKYAVILFYFAVEELGKALKLKEKLEEVKQNNPQMNNIQLNWWKDHDKKITRAQREFPELKIPKYREEKIDEKTFRYILEDDDELIKGFQERSEFFLVGYDMKKEQWVNDLSTHIEDAEVINKINYLDSILDRLQQKFN